MSSSPAPAPWMTALAATAVDPGTTVTPEMAARLGAAATTDARRSLPFRGLSSRRLPTIDVRSPRATGTTPRAIS